MSDSQTTSLPTEQRQSSELLARQQQAQQRQILAMMGIGQWVRPDSPTLKISDITESAGDIQAPDSLTGQRPVSDEQVRPEVRGGDPIDRHTTTAPVASDDEVLATCPSCSTLLAVIPSKLSIEDKCPNCNANLVN